MRALLAAAAAAAPGAALACPACARDASPLGQILGASMILLPFAVTAVVIRVVRRGGERPEP